MIHNENISLNIRNLQLIIVNYIKDTMCCFWIDPHSCTLIQQLYGHLPPISLTIQIRWARHAGHYERSKNTHKWCAPIWSYTWTHQCWLTCRNLHSSALWWHWMLSREPNNNDASRESQMVMINIDNVFF